MSGAVAEAGTATRLETCKIHGIPFGQVFLPPIPGVQGYWAQGHWTGSCPRCDEAGKPERQVIEFLVSQGDEIANEATKIIQQREHQAAIERRTKKDLAVDVAEFERERLPLWKDYNTNLEWNQIVCEIEARKRAEFVEQLRSAERR